MTEMSRAATVIVAAALLSANPAYAFWGSLVKAAAKAGKAASAAGKAGKAASAAGKAGAAGKAAKVGTAAGAATLADDAARAGSYSSRLGDDAARAGGLSDEAGALGAADDLRLNRASDADDLAAARANVDDATGDGLADRVMDGADIADLATSDDEDWDEEEDEDDSSTRDTVFGVIGLAAVGLYLRHRWKTRSPALDEHGGDD